MHHSIVGQILDLGKVIELKLIYVDILFRFEWWQLKQLTLKTPTSYFNIIHVCYNNDWNKQKMKFHCADFTETLFHFSSRVLYSQQIIKTSVVIVFYFLISLNRKLVSSPVMKCLFPLTFIHKPHKIPQSNAPAGLHPHKTRWGI